MNTLVVYSHPCPESFVAAVRDSVLSGLCSGDHAHQLIDLHADGYMPGQVLEPHHRDAVLSAHAVVLVYPTWWSAHPAILLGWLGQAASTGLPNTRRLVSVTTLGGSRLANRVAGESGVRVMGGAVRRLCEQSPSHRRLAFYGLDSASADRRDAFLSRVERRIGSMIT